ncbi:hypothetical protein Kpol_1039p64 [Vanderwaltozyma polyspora DSM 70294]|uniref:WLM domain-containing protein n=1 Tax=Vanderwaltozyma polyspora (strain ATCC 22028 / DSM 70294 / BCRC 21397 / CBS 2163 / NBRC 10782 / NRRL Y-8283 / UCD 57-17) TaxID=436907 RepID=A7THI9_VANPO|nr:uncharacterized protein Kpol_1039p64 [Vanderwaltozyma polyspora DSM 70294]EDO18313.1 hypothetical protein Kpol_1039p64 [Vanderwaltozyma polyspora DSM 70294]
MVSHKNPSVGSVGVLQKRPNKEDALKILKDLAHRVSYLMKEYRFKVGSLVEFYPRDKRLLGMNVNRGQKVMVRLRDPYDEYQFLSRESIMGTILHELTHNLFGPHDNKFYKKLDELIGRQWIIEQQGLFDNFLGNGKTLGNRNDSNTSRETVRKKRIAHLSKGFKLGGLKSSTVAKTEGVSPREMAAAAAMQRNKDRYSCPGESNEKIELIASQEGELEVVIISDDDDDDDDEKEEETIEIIDLT